MTVIIDDLKNVLINSREITSGVVVDLQGSNAVLATKTGKKIVPYTGNLSTGDRVTLKEGVATKVPAGKIFYI